MKLPLVGLLDFEFVLRDLSHRRQINSSNFFSENVVFTNALQKSERVNFHNFHTVSISYLHTAVQATFISRNHSLARDSIPDLVSIFIVHLAHNRGHVYIIRQVFNGYRIF